MTLSLLPTPPRSVVGAVVNSQEFAEAFQCKEDSAMNPKNKCELW